MKKRNVKIYVAAGCVLAVFGVSGYLVHESRMLSYFSSDPKVCINCHTMNTHYATWQHSSHREWATCVDCHLPQESLAGKMVAKARDGFNHSVAMTLGNYGSNLRVTKDAARRIQDNCIVCHQEAVSQMQVNAELYQQTESDVAMGRTCWDCHRGLPHGITRPLTATQNNLGVKEL